MHRVVNLDLTTEKKRKVVPYLKESVGFSTTLGQIRDMLRKYECEQIVTAEKEVRDAKNVNYTAHTMAFVVRGEKFIIEFPVIFAKNTRGRVLRMDISGRLIFYKIKSLLADVEIGYLAFSEAMMQYQVVALPDGHQVMLMDYVKEHGPELAAGTADLLLLAGEKR